MITKFWLRMARFLLYILVWFVVIGLLPVPAGMWHFGGNLQCCSPYLCPEPFISSSFESSCFCKMSAHTSEADLLFLPVKSFSFSSYFLLVMRPSTLYTRKKIVYFHFCFHQILYFFLPVFSPSSTPAPSYFSKTWNIISLLLLRLSFVHRIKCRLLENILDLAGCGPDLNCKTLHAEF